MSRIRAMASARSVNVSAIVCRAAGLLYRILSRPYDVAFLFLQYMGSKGVKSLLIT